MAKKTIVITTNIIPIIQVMTLLCCRFGKYGEILLLCRRKYFLATNLLIGFRRELVDQTDVLWLTLATGNDLLVLAAFDQMI